ncbi:TBPIP-domain-containing protein [Phellopilus nigrolimitatus]|nr:TBPIP-domain-containing protein [Phellopilus nigrolimitatus]
MPGKVKENADKTPVLKGQEAEDAILKYLKKMNRPFGAVDVCANLKGAVPKTATQKILLSLAEKGEITQKPYGKTTFFVAKQSDLEDMPADKLAALEAENKSIEEENKLIGEEIKKATAELAKLKSTPTDEELYQQIREAKAAVKKSLDYLTPLRAGTSLVSPEEIAQLDKDWMKWRAEWISRRKIYTNLWHLVSDSLSPQDANDLAEDLGIECDTTEHGNIERGPLCTAPLKKR